jgi:hypothetical protein
MRVRSGSGLGLLVVALVLVAGCGGSKPGGNPLGGSSPDAGLPDGGLPDAGPLTSLDLEPQNAVLTINGTQAASASYTLKASFQGGAVRDVTSLALLSVTDSSVGTISGGTFTSDVQKGGQTQVTAQYQGVSVATNVTVVKKASFTSTSGTATGGPLPADPSAPFNGPADASRAPTLVYPNDGVLVPPNLGQLEFHFLPGSAQNTLFRVQFENATTAVTVYLRCGAPDATRVVKTPGCVYVPEPNVWSALAETNRGGDPVMVSVQGTDDAGSAVGSSGTIHLSFSQADLHGGLYYWTTSGVPLPDGGSLQTAIMRFDFAGTQSAAQRYIDPVSTGQASAYNQGNVSCLGCHALSHDGSKMVAEVNGQNDGRTLLWSVADAGALVPFPTSSSSVFESWNPDGSQYVSADFDNGNPALRIIDGNTGGVLSTLTATGTSGNPADHPDWSPDGQRIVYVKIGDTSYTSNPGDTGGTEQRMHKGALELISQLPDGGWSAPSELVPAAAGLNHYYPAFSPDNRFIVYDQSKCTGSGSGGDISCNADTDPTATLYALWLDGGSPVLLSAANTPGPLDRLSDGGVQSSLTDSFPKWSPFINQRTHDANSQVMWLTFSSTRRFGVYSPPSAGGEAQLGVETFVWMAAIDPSKVAGGQDPSYPAFVLPFQDFTTSNHIAQWATQVVQGTCVQAGGICDPNASAASGNACCAGLTCVAGTGDPAPSSCQAVLH